MAPGSSCKSKNKNVHAIGNIAENVDVDVRWIELLRPILMPSFLQTLCQRGTTSFAGTPPPYRRKIVKIHQSMHKSANSLPHKVASAAGIALSWVVRSFFNAASQRGIRPSRDALYI